MQEIFKDIPNYEGLYQVSNLGRVKSLDRLVSNKHGKRTVKGSFLKPYLTNYGYHTVCLMKESKGRTTLVHVLVAEAFLGYNVNEKGIVCDHIDEDKTNNKLSNLQLITHRENVIKSKNKQKTGANYDKVNKNWRSRIWIDGKSKFLGTFKTKSEAISAYQKEVNQIKQL